MTLRIGVDLDGVLADMDGSLAAHAARLFPAMPSGNDGEVPATPRRLTTDERKQLWRHIRGIDGFWETLAEVEPGAVAQLAELATGLGWETVFLTSRPATRGAPTQLQSQRWLQAQGFPMPSVCVVGRSRGKIAAALDLHVIVDDTLENCVDVATDSRAQVIGIFRNTTRIVPASFKHPGVQVVRTTAAALDLLREMDPDAARWNGAIRRMLKALNVFPSRDGPS